MGSYVHALIHMHRKSGLLHDKLQDAASTIPNMQRCVLLLPLACRAAHLLQQNLATRSDVSSAGTDDRVLRHNIAIPGRIPVNRLHHRVTTQMLPCGRSPGSRKSRQP